MAQFERPWGPGGLPRSRGLDSVRGLAPARLVLTVDARTGCRCTPEWTDGTSLTSMTIDVIEDCRVIPFP